MTKIEGEAVLVKNISRNEMTRFILSNKWETEPVFDVKKIYLFNMTNGFYILRDSHTKCNIGIMVLIHDFMDVFEILPAYRNKGYAKSILSKINFNAVNTLEETIPFWNKFINVNGLHNHMTNNMFYHLRSNGLITHMSFFENNVYIYDNIHKNTLLARMLEYLYINKINPLKFDLKK